MQWVPVRWKLSLVCWLAARRIFTKCLRVCFILAVKGTCMSGLAARNDDAAALLMCGVSPFLLETRTRVLQHAGFAVDRVNCPGEAEKRLMERRYRLLLICHSANEYQVATLREIAMRAGVRSYWIEPLTPPETLIADITALVQCTSKVECGSAGSDGPGGQRKATA